MVSDSKFLDFKMAVAKVGNDEWKAIAEYLGYQSYEITDLPSMDRNSDRLLYLINKWSRKNGRKANVGELLRACQKAGVPLPLIKEEYSKSHLS